MSRTRIRYTILVLAAVGFLLAGVTHILNKRRGISLVLSELRQNGVTVRPILIVPAISNTRSTSFITTEIRGLSRYGVCLPPGGNTYQNLRLIAELGEFGSLHSLSCTSPGVSVPGFLPIETVFQDADSSGTVIRRLRAMKPAMEVFAIPPAKGAVVPQVIPQSPSAADR